MSIIDKIKNFFPSPSEMSSRASLFFTKNLFDSFNSRRISDSSLMSEGFISNSDIYSVVTKITNAIRTLPLTVIDTRRKKEFINDGRVYDLLHNPNKSDRTKDLMEKASINILVTGDLFFWLVGLSDGYSFPQEIICLRSVCVDVNIGNEGKVLSYTYNDGSRTYKLSPIEVLHIKLYDPSKYGVANKRGLSPVQPGYNILDASNELAVADAFTLKNKGASGFIASDGKDRMTRDEAEILQSKLSENIGGSRNKGKISVSGANAKFVQVSMSPTDLKIQESYIVKLRQICNILGVDSSLLNDPSNKRFNNQKEADKYLYTKAAIPILERITDPISKRLNELNNNVRIEPDLSKVESLQSDQSIEVDKNVKKQDSFIKLITDFKEGRISREQAEIIIQNTWKLTEEEIQKLF